MCVCVSAKMYELSSVFTNKLNSLLSFRHKLVSLCLALLVTALVVVHNSVLVPPCFHHCNYL